MNIKHTLTPITGLTAIVIYLIFTLISFLQYPSAYSPLNNWLSDLGNPLENPTGAIYYNTGCIITALLLTLFCIGLRIWDTGTKRVAILLTIAQITGILAAISLIIAAVFPLGTFSQIHTVSSPICTG